eukprot:g38771.t1
MLHEMVPKSALGLSDVEEATLGAMDTIDQVGAIASDMASSTSVRPKHRLGDHFVELLCSVCDNQQHLPVTDHFNSLSHSLGDMSILGLLQCHNDATRKLKEQHLIFCLRSLQPNGLNIEFTSFEISPPLISSH